MPRKTPQKQIRTIAYVTGSRAEFGLMTSTLAAIRDHPRLRLQLIVTGMHLSRAHGRTIDAIRTAGWQVDATVPWTGDVAAATGAATAGFAKVFARLQPDVALVCGDRVEPFAAAAAAHLGGRIVAHVHGGDRALGQVDDTLRHVITKLSHLHFPATAASAKRIFQLGEDRFRIHRTGTPGLDGVAAYRGATAGGSTSRKFALIVLHPDNGNDVAQRRQATMLIAAAKAAGIERGVIVNPNNDPGWRGIDAAWRALRDPAWAVHADLPRETYLTLIASAAMLIGNSSSGIIEAASLGTMVINVGDRQKGRERSGNVINVAWNAAAIARAIARVWNNGRVKTFRGSNVYGAADAGRKIAGTLATVAIDDRLRSKLIRY